MLRLPITRALILACDRWTADVDAAREDYYRAPSRACHATPTCADLRDNGALFCAAHVAMKERARANRWPA